MRIAVPLAKSVLLSSQLVPQFRCRPGYSSLPSGASDVAKARFEFDDSENFLENLRDLDLPVLLRDKTVLDFGSGYGGRTAWLAQWAKTAVGLEIVPRQVEASRAAFRDRPNCRFEVSDERTINFPDGAFDLITTFDVLEHVKHPDIIIREWFRVLKPGGLAIVIFTPYYGASSHHLNYVTTAPGIHWVFSAEVLMTAVAELAKGRMRDRIDVKNIPPPARSYDGTRSCLPTLNGLTKKQFVTHVTETGYVIHRISSRAFLDKWRAAGKAGAAVNRALCAIPGLDEPLAHNLTAILSKPAR